MEDTENEEKTFFLLVLCCCVTVIGITGCGQDKANNAEKSNYGTSSVGNDDYDTSSTNNDDKETLEDEKAIEEELQNKMDEIRLNRDQKRKKIKSCV